MSVRFCVPFVVADAARMVIVDRGSAVATRLARCAADALEAARLRVRASTGPGRR